MKRSPDKQNQAAAAVAWKQEQAKQRPDCPKKKPVHVGLETTLLTESKKALHEWLADDRLTYLEIQNRLKTRFSICVSQQAICRYRGRHLKAILAALNQELPQPSSATRPAAVILHIEGSARIDVRVSANQAVSIKHGAITTIEISE
jgi:hypothetical protein